MLIDAKFNIDNAACYPADRLHRLYDRPMTILEVLTRKDGEWANVSAKDRFWVFSRQNAASERVQRLVACYAAESLKPTDPRSINAILVARRFADGKATTEELQAAGAAAWASVSAARSAARAAAWASVSAARSAARAARSAAVAATTEAAGAAAWSTSAWAASVTEAAVAAAWSTSALAASVTEAAVAAAWSTSALAASVAKKESAYQSFVDEAVRLLKEEK